MRKTAAVALGLLLGFTACDAVESEDGEDDSFVVDGKLDGSALAEGSPLAKGILGVVNQSTERELHERVGLTTRTAHNIVTARHASDDLIVTLEELDDIPWVGTASFRRLRDYANT